MWKRARFWPASISPKASADLPNSTKVGLKNNNSWNVELSTDWGARYWDWLTRSALPLWAQQGVDPAGGYQELLGQDGTPAPARRRARVQGRQSFVFAHAGTLGWTGPWRDLAGIGLDWLERHCRRADGLYATLAAPDGTLIDQTAMTYDQAFALLAAAELHRHGMGLGETYAVALMTRIADLRRLPQGGFAEADGRFLSNPHMHLFEAALAWMEAGDNPLWTKIASEIAALALTRFIDPRQRVLREFFDAGWGSGRVVEPGHQFEWAWLLERFARASRDTAAHEAAHALFVAGKAGVDAARGVAMDEAAPGQPPVRATARLWPQTEWVKAACLLGDAADVDASAATLWRYLETPKAGLWRDKMREDGSFVEEPAPASSLYHIICAVASLKDLT